MCLAERQEFFFVFDFASLSSSSYSLFHVRHVLMIQAQEARITLLMCVGYVVVNDSLLSGECYGHGHPPGKAGRMAL